MRRANLQLYRIIVCLTVIFITSNTVFAETITNIQSYNDDDQILIYVPSMDGEVVSTSAQIGNAATANAELKAIGDVEGSLIHTTILFDNSLSISAGNRNKMKDVVKGLIDNHAPGELFTLTTFDREIHKLSVNSTNYEELIAKVDAIEFINQDTYLKDALYEAFKDDAYSGKAYQNFVVLSDGSDDNDVGYTYNEIITLLKNRNYQIFSVGSRYESNIGALEEMFSISRAANSPYFLLDDSDDISGIVAQISQDRPQYIGCIDIPESVKDGSVENIKLTINTSANEYNLLTEATMPFADMSINTAVEAQETETEKGTAAETETEKVTKAETNQNGDISENTVKDTYAKIMKLIGDGNQILILGIIVSFIVLIIIVLLILRKKKVNKDQDNIEEDDATVLIKHEDDEDDDATVLMRGVKDDDAIAIMKKSRTIILAPEGNYSQALQCKCETEISIGRKRNCDICIENDKAVSGVHCIVFYDYDGDLAIKDNSSSNGTYLNDEKIFDERKLESGDTLEIGKTRYNVQIIGE